jgi:hypothetical protein
MEPISSDEYRDRCSHQPVDLGSLGIDAKATVAAAWAEVKAVGAAITALMRAGRQPSDDLSGRLRAAESTIYLYAPTDAPRQST